MSTLNFFLAHHEPFERCELLAAVQRGAVGGTSAV